MRSVGLNHIDVWGFRGMAFAKRQLPLTVGAEAACEVVAVGDGVDTVAPGDRVVPFAALTCGTCPFCARGQDNLCENVAGVRGFHVDGFAQEITNHPARLAAKIPDTVDAARRGLRRRRLRNGRAHAVRQRATGTGRVGAGACRRLRHRLDRDPGGEIDWLHGDHDGRQRRQGGEGTALGADHVINYREDRFEGVVRKLTAKRGVDVVFEHVGADTWQGSLLSLRRGGRLVTCGATSGPAGNINLMQLFQQQYRIIGRFGAPLSAHSRARWRGSPPA